MRQDIGELKEDINGLDKQIGVIDARLEDWKPSVDKISDLAEKAMRPKRRFPPHWKAHQ